VAISLGKDCYLTLDGSAVAGVRDVTIDVQTESVQIRPFYARTVGTYQTGYSITMAVETIDDGAAAYAVGLAQSGAQLSVAANGWSFYAVVVGVQESQPLDDVRSWQITLQSTINGMRS